MELIKSPTNKPQKGFLWRDRGGNFHDPKEMETKHVFFTLRMIWNHAAPPEMQIEPFKRYSFSSFYTREYIKEAVYCLSRELETREMAPYFILCMEIIKGYINILYGQPLLEETKMPEPKKDIKDIIKILGNALQEASDHLDFCGYGDRYERGCAESSGLHTQIETALKEFYEFTEE